MNQTIDGAIQTVKRVSSELRPGMLDDLGLPAAIEWLTQDFGRLTGLKCTFSARCGDDPIDHDLSTALFRICQEALTNVVRHAQATRIAVSLDQDPTRITLKVRDDGKGIEETEILDPRAFGLIGMRERATLWGGEVRFSGAPGKGTVVAVSIPLVERT
jgi:signal transduction histidine kinase